MKKKYLILLIFIIFLILAIPVFAEMTEQKAEIKNLKLISKNEAKFGDILYFDFETTGEINFATVVIQNKEVKDAFALVPILNDGSNIPQIDLSYFGTQKVIAGEYYISDVFLNPDDSSKYVHYSLEPDDEETKKLNYNIEFTIKEEMKLNNIALKENKEIKLGENLKFEVDVSGEISYISCVFRQKDTGRTVIGYLNNSFTEIDVTKMSDQLVEGEYYLSDVFLTGDNTENIHYSNYSVGEDIIYLDSKVEFTVVENEETEQKSKIELYGMRINSQKAKLNEKVYVEFDTSELPNNIMLSFFNNDTGDMLTADLKDIDTTNPYFVIPSNTKPGNYELNYAILEDFDGNESHYRKAEQYGSIEHFDFNYFLEIQEDLNFENNILNIDNEKIDDDILKQIKDLDSNISININTNNNSTVSADVFETIKGENKILILNNGNIEWIFNGNDIKDLKSIDTRVNVFELSKETNSNINEKLKNGIVLEFASNGKLPGKCLIRLKHNKALGKELNNNVNLYYYNQENNTIEKLDTQIIVTKDNYYEFYIDHNSKYILSEENIEDNTISDSTQELININNKFLNKSNIIKIIAIIICIIVLILIFSRKILAKRKKNKEE